MPAKANTPGSTLDQNVEKLPHERDETPESGAPRRDVIRQAESDVSSGQIDTDNYTRMRETARRSPNPRTRIRQK